METGGVGEEGEAQIEIGEATEMDMEENFMNKNDKSLSTCFMRK